jgi:hypothetical protein
MRLGDDREASEKAALRRAEPEGRIAIGGCHHRPPCAEQPVGGLDVRMNDLARGRVDAVRAHHQIKAIGRTVGEGDLRFCGGPGHRDDCCLVANLGTLRAGQGGNQRITRNADIRAISGVRGAEVMDFKHGP